LKLPKSIRVACFDIAIKDWEHVGAAAHSRYGEYSSIEEVIRVDTSHSPVRVAETLIHEISHAIFDLYHLADNDEQERTVGQFATGMTQVLRDNQEVIEFLKDSLLGNETN
jgi:Zn-dependent peptidase ImmA (M78 family)